MQKLSLKNRKGQKIVGVLEVPEGEIKGTCVVQHGYGGQKEAKHIQKMKDVFLDNGFITFNFDTTNSFGQSDGDFEEARLGLHAEDLEDVAQWMQQQDWFQKPFALTGHSMGGYAVAKYAEDYSEKVDILAPIAPVVSGELSFEATEEKWPNSLERWKKEGVRIAINKSTGVTKKSPWAQMEERLDHNLLPNAKNITMPTLLVVGTEDKSCRLKDVKKLYDALPVNDKNHFAEIQDAPHIYISDKNLEELYKIIDSWLKSL
ncbi:MAG: alpha/beta fold hydrolase [Patescibacteria group bacterium]